MLSELLEFTEPTIVTSDDLGHRSFISFMFDGKPQKLYHGKKIGKEINPNLAKSLDERNRLPTKLHFEVKKSLEARNYPIKRIDESYSQLQFDSLPLIKKSQFGQMRNSV